MQQVYQGQPVHINKPYAERNLLKKERIIGITLLAISILCVLVAAIFPPVCVPFFITAGVVCALGSFTLGAADLQEAFGKGDLIRREKIARIVTGALFVLGGFSCFTFGMVCLTSAIIGKGITHWCIDRK